MYKVGIVMGSDSDLPIMQAAIKALAEFGIEHETRVISAHRTPQMAATYAETAVERGLSAIIAGAGGAAHLAGVLAASTPLPVIGVPVKSAALNGLDSLLSIVQMPSGIPVATVAIDGARNAGILAAQIDPFLPLPPTRNYQPPKAAPAKPGLIQVRFDFSPAEQLLDALSAQDTPDATWERLSRLPVFTRLRGYHNELPLPREELLRWWKRAQDPDPANRLYEWVYPGSYGDFGGAAVYADLYRDAIASLRANAPSLSAGVTARLSPFLPPDLRLNATVAFLFAPEADAWASGSLLGVNFEHFGGDYDHLTRVMAHECYHLAESSAQIPITTLSRDPTDQALVDGLMSRIWREGCAAYAGNSWPHAPAKAEIDRGRQEARG
ncbi:MAG: 5-(carboxyamino)imidazole ribonucleotide mutase, partial [Methanobacterium paludis]|nr:5-(carboxyamino)imidazole ribonucleotide mutase [Methanobacterium paludis]